MYLKSAIEGVVIKWATQINDVLTQESSQAFDGGRNPTPNAGKLLKNMFIHQLVFCRHCSYRTLTSINAVCTSCWCLTMEAQIHYSVMHVIFVVQSLKLLEASFLVLQCPRSSLYFANLPFYSNVRGLYSKSIVTTVPRDSVSPFSITKRKKWCI